MSGKLFIKTHGCQMNEYDSDKMAEVLAASHGLELTENEADADVVLINTCSIREKAQEKVFSQLGRWKHLKKNNPNVVIGVGGCVASQEGEAIIKRAPFVDLVFGPQTLHRLPKMIDQTRQKKIPMVDISFPEIEKFDHLPEPGAKGPTAFVSIMEGCSKYCTFCVVPYTRGEEVSRPFDDVIAECASLASQGVKEINLLGQNVNAYQGSTHDDNIADLALLIHYVAAIEGIERIRFTTSHPVEFSQRQIEVFGEVPELAGFLHLPVQSGSDRILGMMKRGHTVLEYKQKIRRLRETRPGISISSDFIIGFPGETDADFNATMKLIDDIGFDHSFSFIYSARPGTPAASFTDDVPMAVKKQRLQILQKKITANSQAISRGMLGTVQRVLVEGPGKKGIEGQFAARTENNRIVNFDGHSRLVGEFIDVVITEVLSNSLRGRIHTTESRTA
ncbi:MAG: tRNA (N6-isopentenyl adenosine(37)-C2)-methylthiotransferase MiaB [Xanthomonadales bacterium]|nr:tRNA (N6-isopentenyl adenosine(37)-C2)-methylthiotransferase MiaB [Xanthomonadales bacterium]